MYKQLFFGDSDEMEGLYFLNEDIIQRMIANFSSSDFKSKETRFKCAASEGNPLEEMLDLANEIQPDLLVIGKKQQASNHGILAKNMVRKSQQEVLIIPEHTPETLDTILVPIDFSEYSAKALGRAIQIAKLVQPSPKILATHVFTMPNLSVYKASKTIDQFEKMMEENMREAFNAFIAKQHPGEVDVKLNLIMRDMPGISSYLFNAAKETTADLIIIGAKGHSKVELLMMGSVTEKLINLNKEIPMWIVK